MPMRGSRSSKSSGKSKDGARSGNGGKSRKSGAKGIARKSAKKARRTTTTVAKAPVKKRAGTASVVVHEVLPRVRSARAPRRPTEPRVEPQSRGSGRLSASFVEPPKAPPAPPKRPLRTVLGKGAPLQFSDAGLERVVLDKPKLARRIESLARGVSFTVAIQTPTGERLQDLRGLLSGRSPSEFRPSPYAYAHS